MRRPWSLPVRTWLSIALVAVVLSPLLSWLGVIVATRGPMKTRPSPWEEQFRGNLADVVLLIEGRRADWGAATFQQELGDRLTRSGLSAALFNADGELLFKEGAIGGDMVGPVGHEMLMAYGDRHFFGIVRDPSGEMAGMYLVSRTQGDPMMFIILYAALGGLTLALVFTVWRVSRSISRPLHALARAAHLINQGELGFDLPESRVRELNELGAAFAAMRDGLRESIGKQSEMEQERRLFIAAVAHDLRTPLSSVRGYLEGLRDGVARTPEKAERYIAVALDKTGTLERLIENLFAYSRAEYLHQPPQMEELNLGDLLRSALEGVKPLAEARGVSLALEPGDVPCPVQGDPQMLTRVIDNLLDNALRYTPAGGSVRLGWDGGPEGCRFWVQDTGPGIPEEDLKRVFQPLYRGDKARSSSTGGTGLGLAIAQRLVEAHGGTIAVANVDGAQFTVTLPTQSKGT